MPASPVPISPADRTVFDTYPRTTTLRWSPVDGAAKYGVEVEFGDPGRVGGRGVGRGNVDGFVVIDWHAETATEQEGLSYTFNFVGQQPGRWRVWAIGANGQAGTKSEWRLFRYTQ